MIVSINCVHKLYYRSIHVHPRTFGSSPIAGQGAIGAPPWLATTSLAAEVAGYDEARLRPKRVQQVLLLTQETSRIPQGSPTTEDL